MMTRDMGDRLEIIYKFTLKDGSVQHITVDLDRPAANPAGAAPWTALPVNQCPNCPLDAQRHSHCPAALDLVPVITAFAQIISYEQAQVEVETPERTVSKDCQVQQALSSLVALTMATSACPILGKMRNLAMTHLPFATSEETLFRSLGAYLITQLIAERTGGQPDWALDGLKQFYADLEVLNKHFKKRINAAAKQDAAINAVSALGVLSLGVGLSIEDSLEELHQFTLPAAETQ